MNLLFFNLPFLVFWVDLWISFTKLWKSLKISKLLNLLKVSLKAFAILVIANRKFKINAPLSKNSAMNEGKAGGNHYDCWWKPKPQVIPEREVVGSRPVSVPSLFANNEIRCRTYECPIPCNCAYPCQDEPGLSNTYTNPCCRGCEFWTQK